MSGDTDPDLKILREAESKRGGCGAFLVGVVVFFVTDGVLFAVVFALEGRLSPTEQSIGVFGALIVAVTAAIQAAKLITKARLRLAGKEPESPKN